MNEKLISLISKQTKLKNEEVAQLLSVPPNPKLGDYAFPCFKLGTDPSREAQKLKQKIKLPRFISKVEAIGPYLNFFLRPSALAEETLITIKKEGKKYGAGREKKNIVIEYCGPNTNKPLHLGHLRNMALGSAVCRLLDFQGNNVHPVNIVNDRGIHICQSMLAYQKWGQDKKPTKEKKGDHFVGDYYVLFSRGAKENENLNQEAQELLLKWEKNDPKTRALWKKMNKWVVAGFAKTYNRFGIAFEKEYFESEYYEKGKTLVKNGLKKKVFLKDGSGAVIAPLEKYQLPDKVVLRADETSLYITQDMYLADLRYHDFKFEKMIYVVASEQELHFQQLFKILELLKRSYAAKMHHLSYGLVQLPSGRMKSREGTVVDADEVMDEVFKMVMLEVIKKHPGLSQKEIKKRGELIAQGAIKFFLLKTDAVRNIIFNPEESLNFEGETGPYVQYTHARACSILRKAKPLKGKVNLSLLESLQEHNLIKLLADFPRQAKEAAQHYKPHLICHYLISLSQAFNEFYHAHQVISNDLELMKARLLVVEDIKQVLENGLSLLGIAAPEMM